MWTSKLRFGQSVPDLSAVMRIQPSVDGQTCRTHTPPPSWVPATLATRCSSTLCAFYSCHIHFLEDAPLDNMGGMQRVAMELYGN